MSAVALAALAAAASPGSWTLVLEDEFSKAKIDTAIWSYADDCWGGGNDERQCYTRSRKNAAVVDGKLVITARKERTEGPAVPRDQRALSGAADKTAIRAFSSARLSTKGKASWRYGKIEVRARLPQGQGTWPAIWMLPERDTYGKWAASGEIDILEAVNLGVPCAKCPGGRESTILGTLHFGGAWPANKHKGEEVVYPPVLDGGFHVFAIEWSADRMVWRVDGQPYATRLAHEWSTTGSPRPGAPFDQPFYLILNFAIGGRLAEERGLGGVDTEGYPRRFEVDWVRVWQCAADRDTGRACMPADKGAD